MESVSAPWLLSVDEDKVSKGKRENRCNWRGCDAGRDRGQEAGWTRKMEIRRDTTGVRVWVWNRVLQAGGENDKKMRGGLEEGHREEREGGPVRLG